MNAEVCQQISASIAVKQALIADATVCRQIERLIDGCVRSLCGGGKIIFAGNGGSFADAHHLSAEFVSRFVLERAPLASVVLGSKSSAMSAIGNDYGFDQVFARELEGLANPDDTFIPMSTSGNSSNILAAVQEARVLGLTTLAFTGESGGALKSLCECLCVPSSETARIQECHIMLGHIICGLVEKAYFKENR